MVDNVEYDAESGMIYAGAMPQVGKLIIHARAQRKPTLDETSDDSTTQSTELLWPFSDSQGAEARKGPQHHRSRRSHAGILYSNTSILF